MHADVFSILRHYPRIYMACHVDHVRKQSTPFALSARDSSLLAHLSGDEPMTAAALARHVGIRPSTLSAALKHLYAQGYVARSADDADRRVHRLRLTALGAAAVAATSVLDSSRVQALLECLTAPERQCAIDGLALLAKAASTLTERENTR